MKTLEQWESLIRSTTTGLSFGQVVVVARQAQEDELAGLKRASVWHAMRVLRPAGAPCPCAVCAAHGVGEVPHQTFSQEPPMPGKDGK